MSNDYTVKAYGKDTSGRTIWMTVYMHDWWEGVVKELGFRPTVVQGAFMTRNGGGASASAGYHDKAGCFDVRTWDLTLAQLNELIKVCRKRGGAAWRRDKSAVHGGMDPHCHITLGTDSPLSAGAAASWRSYVDGRNGLANGARDYEWRPSPLVTTPPPPPAPKPNSVQLARRSFRQGLRQLRQVSADRKVVKNQASIIRQALRAMPKK